LPSEVIPNGITSAGRKFFCSEAVLMIIVIDFERKNTCNQKKYRRMVLLGKFLIAKIQGNKFTILIKSSWYSLLTIIAKSPKKLEGTGLGT